MTLPMGKTVSPLCLKLSPLVIGPELHVRHSGCLISIARFIAEMQASTDS